MAEIGVMENQLHQIAKHLLETGEVKYIIGWEKGRFEHSRHPAFINNPEDATKLVWDKYCLNTLAKYLMDDKYPEVKIGICVRGCDSRAVNRLIMDKQILRENLYLIGMPCDGKLEKNADGEFVEAKKCTQCEYRNPVDYDVLIGDLVVETPKAERFLEVEEIERLSADERYAYFEKMYEKCIRCYACRNVCPACNCRECFVDQHKEGWQGKQNNCAQNQVYGITRAFHVGDRCIECGECERVCPMGLPLMALNRKMVKDINDLFGEHTAGMDTKTEAPLGVYDLGDPEEYM